MRSIKRDGARKTKKADRLIGESAKKKTKSKMTASKRRGTGISWLYLSPSLAGVLLFFVLPFFVVVFYSLVDNPINMEFVFFDNFVKMMSLFIKKCGIVCNID